MTERGTKVWYRCGRVKGKQKRIRIGGFPEFTVKQARDECRRLTGDIAARRDPLAHRGNANDKTIQEVFDWYLEFQAKPNKQTWERDVARYDNQCKKVWGSRKLSSITVTEIRERQKAITEESGPFSANEMLRVLNAIFNTAIKNKWIKESPVAEVSKTPDNVRDRFLSAEELERWFAAVENLARETTRDFFLLALFTGARRSNVQSMRWNEIDMERRVWTIPAEKFKTGKKSVVVLVPQAHEILERRRADYDSEWVLPGQGRKGHLVYPHGAWKKICEWAELEDLRIHDLRRTLGSWQAATGASLPIIGKSLGHTSQSATAVYARVDLDPVRAAVETAVDAIDAIRKKSQK